MRLPTVILGLCIAAMAAVPALAKTFDTPKALLQALYSDKSSADDEEWSYKSYYSDHLNGLFKADRATTASGEEGALGFDPVISGQDGEATKVKIGEPVISGDKAEVVVKFVNFEPVTLNYTLVKEHGGWKVDDIGNKGGQFPWKLSKIFADAK